MNPNSHADMAVWLAAGVQHAVLLRTMPALRHELAGSVSVQRMALAILKRKMQSSGDTMETHDVQSRVQSLESSVGELSANLRRLRYWDKQPRETLAPQTLMQEVWGMVHPFLALRNIAMEELPASPDIWPQEHITPQPLMYLALATIYHLAEAGESTPARLSARPMLTDAGDVIRFESSGVAITYDDGRAEEAAMNMSTPPITLQALDCLASQMRVSIQVVNAHCIDLPLFH
ncbi:hypothetical protein [Diaphorobacter sp.]|uniref:hypothetical protein n=1 Tax=Diaphorobacter sp. TaxID=1934310 RepID=UPI0028B237E5|nr:hypothetical protein [Diaphorobacter sp.]